MERKFAQLQQIEHNEEITAQNHYAFLYQLQKALLLALREQGRLGIMQYRHAEEKLKHQRLNLAKRIRKKGETG